MKRILGCLVLALLAALPISAVVASATPSVAKPGVWLAFVSSRINAGSTARFTYTTRHVPANSKLYLQRQFGLLQVWRAVQTLKGLDGRTSTVALPIGRYHYRVAVLVKGRLLATSGTEVLYSYGSVPLAILCKAPNTQTSLFTPCTPGTVQVGQRLFTYEMTSGYFANQFPSYSNVLTFPANSCRRLSLAFGLNSNQSQTSDTAYVQILQTTLDPERASTPQGTLGKLVAHLDSGPWYLQAATTNGDQVYFNGQATCWSSDGE